MLGMNLRALLKPSTKQSTQAPLWILAILASGLLVREAAPIFMWIMSAFFVFTLLDSPAEYLKSKSWPVAWTAILLVLLASAVLSGTLYLLGRLLTALVQELEQSRHVFVESFDALSGYWNSMNARITALYPVDAHPGVTKVELAESSPLGGAVGGTILHGVHNAVAVMTFALLVPVLAFFLLAERDAMAAVIGRAFRDVERPRRAWAQIKQATWAFFAGNLVLGLITYPLFALLLYAFGVPSVMVTAALAAFLNLVPFAGALLAGLLPAVALYSQTQTLTGALVLYGCCLAIHLVVADFLTPKMLGSRVNINATTSTIALVAWGEMWGGVGLLLAIPITSVIKICFEHSDSFWLRWCAQMMSHQVDASLELNVSEPAGKT